MNADVEQAVEVLESLDRDEKVAFLVSLAHNATVSARGYYAGPWHSLPEDCVAALQSHNEMLHAVSGYVAHVLRGDGEYTPENFVANFIGRSMYYGDCSADAYCCMATTARLFQGRELYERDSAEWDRREAMKRHEYRLIAEPVLRELETAGYEMERLRDLRRDDRDLDAAIPILLRWLPKIDDPRVKFDILTALATPAARPVAARAIVDEFRWLPRHDSEGVRVAAAMALQSVADDEVLDDILRLIVDPGQPIGAQRMLVQALGNMTKPRAVAALIALIDHEDLAPYAIDALLMMPEHLAAPARPHLDRFIDVFEPPEELLATRRRAVRLAERLDSASG